MVSKRTLKQSCGISLLLAGCLIASSGICATGADDLIGNIKGLVSKNKKQKSAPASSDAKEAANDTNPAPVPAEQPNVASDLRRFDVKGLSLGQSVADAKQKVGGVCNDTTPSEGKQYHYLILECSDPKATLAEKPLQSQTLYFVDDKLVRSVGVVLLLRNDFLKTRIHRYDSGDVMAEQSNFIKVLSTKYGTPLDRVGIEKARVNKITPFTSLLSVWKNTGADEFLVAAPTENDTKDGKDNFVLLELTSKEGVDQLVAIKKAADQQAEDAKLKQEQEISTRKAKDL